MKQKPKDKSSNIELYNYYTHVLDWIFEEYNFMLDESKNNNEHHKQCVSDSLDLYIKKLQSTTILLVNELIKEKEYMFLQNIQKISDTLQFYKNKTKIFKRDLYKKTV